MSFERPWILGLLLLLPLLEWFLRRAATQRPLWLSAVQLGALAALLLALAQPVLHSVSRAPLQVLVLDRSPSMAGSDAAQQAVLQRLIADANMQRIRVVAFGASAAVLPPLNGQYSLPALQSANGSALAEALQLAADLIPVGEAGRVLLCSDGRATRSEARAVAASMRARGIVLDVAEGAFGARTPSAVGAATSTASAFGARAPNAVLHQVRCPSRARAADTISISAAVDDPRGLVVGAVLRPLEPAGAEQVVALINGSIACEHELLGPGVNRMELVLRAADGATLASVPLACAATEPVRVRMVHGEQAPARSAALRALLGAGFEMVQDAAAPVDVTILDDVPAVALQPEAIEALTASVHSGAGLLVCGGRHSFGPGGYGGSGLDALLPVGPDEKEERRDPSATLVIIIDTSGSMLGARIDIAKEVARLALQRLKPHDKAGIVEFHGAKRWAAPIQSAANAVDLQRALNRLTAGGGTVILPAIEEAYYALLNVRTRTRHVLVITDGGVESGDFESLLRRMADKGITTSTVLAGAGSGHSSFLFSIAQWGRGRFYQAPDRFQLPELRVKQPDSASLSPWRDEVQAVRAVPEARWLEGVASVQGFVETVAKPGAVLDARTANGEPLLARWRFGLGAVAAWTSTLAGVWNAEAAADGSAGRSFAALVRELAPASSGQAALRLHADRLHVRLPQGMRRAQVFAASAPIAFVDAVLGDAGAWNVVQPVPIGVLTLRAEDGTLLAATERPAESEWTRADPDTAELEHLKLLAADALPAANVGALPLRTPLLACALILFLATIALRRAVLLALLLCLSLDGTALAQEPGVSPAAAAALRQALQGNAGSLEQAVQLECAQHGDTMRLLALATDLLDSSPPAARVIAARLALHAGQPQKGLEFLAPLAAPDAEQCLLRARLQEAVGQDAAAEVSLRQVLEKSPELALETAARLRLAGLLFARKEGNRDEALQVLAPLRATTQPPALRAAVAQLAALHGAVDWLLETPTDGARRPFDEVLLVASMAVESGRSQVAEQLLAEARPMAPRSADRRYIDERTIAIHRAGGSLEKLAQLWQGAESPDAERAAALVALLRELRQPQEALALLRRGGATLDERAQREVIALALECGRHSEVEDAYLQSIAAEPQRLMWSQGLALLRLLQGKRDGAVQALSEVLARTTDGKRLLALGQAAADLGLQEVEQAALEKALAAGGRPAQRARVVMAERAAQAGDDARSKALLTEAESLAAEDGEALLLIAECHERMQAQGEAVRVLRKVVSGSGAEDARMRLGWLLEQRKQGAEALDHWLSIWRTSTVEARVRQAEDRLLELGAREGKLADIAIDIEKALDAGHGDAKSLGLLAKIYLRANDPSAAVEILRAHGPRLGRGEAETLQTMAFVYQHCDEYVRYEETLRRLQELQPEDALELQQQLVLAAMERGRGKAADRALQRLLELGAGDSGVDEFAAGVLGMVQRAPEAALAYGRVLALHPERIESWLLLGNMLRNSGATERGRQLFLALLEDADKDDLFVVAADGLLNLDAPPQMLRPALRRIRERIAARPSSAHLWQLAADFEQELGERERQRLMTVGLAAVSGERRGAYLRELFEMAREDQDPVRVLSEGRSMLALGEEFPPDIFIALGEAMIRGGDFGGAERVFLRARSEGDWLSMQNAVATLYARHGREEDAERMMRQALLARPDDPDLLLQASAYAEVRGDFETASADALHTLSVLFARSAPANISEPSRGARKPARTSASRIRFGNYSYDPQQDSYARHGPHALRVLQCSGDYKSLEALKVLLHAEHARLKAEAVRGERVADHPRCLRLAAAVRDFALALNQPHEAGAVVELLHELFPKDQDAMRAEVNVLAEREHMSTAVACVDLCGLEMKEALPEQWRALLLREPQRLLALAATDPELAAPFAARLQLMGASAEAQALIAALDPATCRVSASERVAFLAAVHEACTAEVFERWWSAALRDSLQGGDALQAARAALRLLHGARLLLPAERKALVDAQLAAVTANPTEKTRTACLLLQRMLVSTAAVQDLPAEALEQLASGNLTLQSLTPLLQAVSPNDRSNLLVRVLSKMQGSERWQLFNVLQQGWADDMAVADALVAAYRAGRKRSAGGSGLPGEYEAVHIVGFETRSPAVLQLLDVIAAEAGESVCIDIARGIALSRAGRNGEAATLLRKGLTTAFAAASLAWQQTRALDLLASTKDETLIALLDEVLKTLEPHSLASSGALRFNIGRKMKQNDVAAALALIEQAPPGLLDAELQNERCELLAKLGRRSEAAHALEEMLRRNPSDREWMHGELARQWLELGQVDRARSATLKLESGGGGRFLLEFAAENDQELLRAWRRHAAEAHSSEYTDILPWMVLPRAPHCSLLDHVASSSDNPTLALLLALPWGEAEALRQLRGLRPDQVTAETEQMRGLDSASQLRVMERLHAALLQADLGTFTEFAHELERCGDAVTTARLLRFEFTRALLELDIAELAHFEVNAAQQPALQQSVQRVQQALAAAMDMGMDVRGLTALALTAPTPEGAAALIERAMQVVRRDSGGSGGVASRAELQMVLSAAIRRSDVAGCTAALVALGTQRAPGARSNDIFSAIGALWPDFRPPHDAAMERVLLDAARAEHGHEGLLAVMCLLIASDRKDVARALLPELRGRLGHDNAAQHHYIEVARAAGDAAEARSMEMVMLQARTLHPLLLPDLMDALQRSMDAAEFALLQAEIATWADCAALRRLATRLRK